MGGIYEVRAGTAGDGLSVCPEPRGLVCQPRRRPPLPSELAYGDTESECEQRRAVLGATWTSSGRKASVERLAASDVDLLPDCSHAGIEQSMLSECAGAFSKAYLRARVTSCWLDEQRTAQARCLAHGAGGSTLTICDHRPRASRRAWLTPSTPTVAPLDQSSVQVNKRVS